MAIGSMEGSIWEYQSACGDLRTAAWTADEEVKRRLAAYLGAGRIRIVFWECECEDRAECETVYPR